MNRRPSRSSRVLSPLRDFLATESSSAVLLAFGAVAALIWVNSPWSEAYHRMWESKVGLSVAGHSLELDLRHWVNDGLMTVFFFVVGLEIKRELTDGHLASLRAALLPVSGAIGGMLVPAALYLLIAGSSAPRGWAVPVATDIALAIGVVSVVGDRVPASLRAFLLGLAIVDDIGAIVIIAIFYSSSVGWGWLGLGAVAFAAAVVARRLGVGAVGVYVALGAAMWFGLHEAGVHPTLAGVAMGLLAPSVPRLSAELIDAEELLDLSDAEAARTTSDLARGSVSVVEWLQHVLHPWTGYVIVPIFALANSGIELSGDRIGDAFESATTWAIVVGLVIGKPVGIVVASLLAIRVGLAVAPDDLRRRALVGVGAAAGIGFTVAIFITELAFTNPDDVEAAKVGVLLASVLAGTLALVLLRSSGQSEPSRRRSSR